MSSFMPVSSLTMARTQTREDLAKSLEGLSLNDKTDSLVAKMAARTLTPLATAPSQPSTTQHQEKAAARAKRRKPVRTAGSTPQLIYEKKDVLLTNVLSMLDVVNQAFITLRNGGSLSTHDSKKLLSKNQRKVFKELRTLLIPQLKNKIDAVRAYLAKISELDNKLSSLKFERWQLEKKFKKLNLPKLAERISEKTKAINSVSAEKGLVPGKEVVDHLSTFETFQSSYVQNEEKYLRQIATELLLVGNMRTRSRGFSTLQILDSIGSNMHRSKREPSVFDKLTLPLKTVSNNALRQFYAFLQNDPYRSTLSADGYTAAEFAILQGVVSILVSCVLPAKREFSEQRYRELQGILQSSLSTDQNAPTLKDADVSDYMHYFRSVYQKEPHENYYLAALKSFVEKTLSPG